MLGQNDAHQHVHVVTHPHAEDIAAAVQIFQSIGHVEKFITDAGKGRILVASQQRRGYMALPQNFRRAQEAFVLPRTADDDGEVIPVRNQCLGELTVHGVMRYSRLLHLQQVVNGSFRQ